MNPWPSWYRPPHKIAFASTIIAAVCAASDFTAEQIKGQKRDRPLARARQVACYLLRKHRRLSYPQIGAMLGGRDHSTIIHAVRLVEDQLGVDQPVTELVATVERAMGVPGMTREAVMALVMQADARALVTRQAHVFAELRA